MCFKKLFSKICSFKGNVSVGSFVMGKKFIFLLIILMIVGLIFVALFNQTVVYDDTMDLDSDEYIFAFNVYSMDHIKANTLNAVYLTSYELGFNHQKIPFNKNEGEFKGVIDIPANVTKFKLEFFCESDFPHVPLHIIVNVNKV